MVDLSVVIITKNAAKTLQAAIESVSWAREVIIIDNQSSDNTIKLAQKSHAKVVTTDTDNFATRRNLGLQNAKYDWILYLDADETVSSSLKSRIRDIIIIGKPNACRIKRENTFLGTKMYPDYVDRLFHKSIIKKWTGKVHESPTLIITARLLDEPLLHTTHTDITSMLEKTNQWTNIEAELLQKANHPPVYWWRLTRMIVTKGWEQIIRKKLLKFKRPGLFEGYFQIINSLITYTKLWEKQINQD